MSKFLSVEPVAILVMLSMGVIVLLILRPTLIHSPGGRALAVIALFALPVASVRAGFNLHYESTKTTSFCLSCHVMEPYGESLMVADESSLPAAHFQNGRIDRKVACFTCHTQYTLFGDLNAKLNGLTHLWVYYTGQTPERIELYSPYQNRECLYCHAGARRFEEIHVADMPELVSNGIKCMDCHTTAHDVAGASAAEKWKPSIQELLEVRP